MADFSRLPGARGAALPTDTVPPNRGASGRRGSPRTMRRLPSLPRTPLLSPPLTLTNTTSGMDSANFFTLGLIHRQGPHHVA